MKSKLKKEIILKKYDFDVIAMVVIVAVFLGLCICRIITNGNYSGDEFYTLEDTLGYLYTGQHLKWDFNANMVTDENAVRQLDFFLLRWLIRIVGTNVYILRGLSAVYSVLTLISLYYIIRKMTKSNEWAVQSCAVLAVNPLFIEMSAIVRGYALLLLLNVWIFYFLYCALNYDGSHVSKYKFHQCFDYRYMFAAFILIYGAFRIRIFQILYLSGIGIYMIIRAIRTREKKFVVMSYGMLIGVLGFLLAIGIHMEKYFSILEPVTAKLERYVSLGWNNSEYIVDLLKIFCFFPMTIGSLICLIVFWTQKDAGLLENKQKDVLLYMFSIVIGTVFLFVTVVGWPYVGRYILPIYPAMIILVTGGFYLFSRTVGDKKYGFMCGMLIFSIGINIYTVVIDIREGGSESAHYPEAYEALEEYIKDTEDAVPFITGIRLRGYYAKEILGEYIWYPMTSKSEDPNVDNLLELSEIGKTYPQGIITCEEEKWYHFRNSFWKVLQTDAFERITGGEKDDTRVGNWAYHLSYEIEGEIAEENKNTTLFGYNYGGSSHIYEEDGKTVVELEINGRPPELTMLCIKINQFYDGEKKSRYLQLILEPEGEFVQYFRIELENQETPRKSMLDDSYYIYVDGKMPEAYEDCCVL